MLVGGFALDHLSGRHVVSDERRKYVRQLMVDATYRGFGWTEEKRPKALELYHMWEARGSLNVDSEGPCAFPSQRK